MKELSQILDELVDAGNSLVRAAEALRECLPAPAEGDAPVQPPSKEDVRKLLVEKTNADGGAHKREVKALIRKYSSDGTLSGVDPEKYEALVEEAGVIGDA